MSNTIHKTNGIVLRCVKYGDTSVIASIYTELFGLQSYIIKGVRKTSKKGLSNANYFTPAAILDMQVYHNEQKQIQFVKEYQWKYLYQDVFFNVVKNAVAMFAVELVQHSIKQPEANNELYYFIEDSLIQLDQTAAAGTANFPLYFALKLGEALGFGIQNNYSSDNNILDVQEGFFTHQAPHHPYFIEPPLSTKVAQVLASNNLNELNVIALNKNIRRQMIDCFNQYFALHISNFIELKTLNVLKEVLD
ncbi:MAG: DNA repair protein RecO [Chitinophagaceae bacterium]|nr:DNA repair protein RecO [Chitinophagaceae bacterium]